jgi:hypothetical protein
MYKPEPKEQNLLFGWSVGAVVLVAEGCRPLSADRRIPANLLFTCTPIQLCMVPQLTAQVHFLPSLAPA